MNIRLTLCFDGTAYCGFQVQNNGVSVCETVQNALEAVLGLLFSRDADGIYNIGSGDIRPLRDYIEELHGLLNSKSLLCFGARQDNAEGPVPLRPSLERIRRDCGFAPRISFQEGIRRMLEAGDLEES